jgi:hypothetical protein
MNRRSADFPAADPGTDGQRSTPAAAAITGRLTDDNSDYSGFVLAPGQLRNCLRGALRIGAQPNAQPADCNAGR